MRFQPFSLQDESCHRAKSSRQLPTMPQSACVSARTGSLPKSTCFHHRLCPVRLEQSGNFYFRRYQLLSMQHTREPAAPEWASRHIPLSLAASDGFPTNLGSSKTRFHHVKAPPLLPGNGR